MKGTLTILFMQYFSFNIFVQLMAYWCRSVTKNSYDKTDYRKKMYDYYKPPNKSMKKFRQ